VAFAIGILLWFAGLRPVRAAPDRCQESAACRRLTDQALALYRQQSYYDALRLLRQAYAMESEPRLLVNIGRCLFQLGLPDQAVTHYRKFLTEDTEREPEARGRVERYIQEAEAELNASAPKAPTPPPDPPPLTPPPVATLPEPPPAPLIPDTPPALPSASLTESPSPRVPAPARFARPRPLYKNPWLWTGVGVAAAALTIGLAVGLTPIGTVPHQVIEWQ
jgi:tetratricopeptide (TPR) repeat protein